MPAIPTECPGVWHHFPGGSPFEGAFFSFLSLHRVEFRTKVTVITWSRARSGLKWEVGLGMLFIYSECKCRSFCSCIVELAPRLVVSAVSELLFAQIPLPSEPAWWSVFGAEKAPLYDIARTIMSLYARPKAVYVRVTEDAWQHSDVLTEVSVVVDLFCLLISWDSPGPVFGKSMRSVACAPTPGLL